MNRNEYLFLEDDMTTATQPITELPSTSEWKDVLEELLPREPRDRTTGLTLGRRGLFAHRCPVDVDLSGAARSHHPMPDRQHRQEDQSGDAEDAIRTPGSDAGTPRHRGRSYLSFA